MRQTSGHPRRPDTGVPVSTTISASWPKRATTSAPGSASAVPFSIVIGWLGTEGQGDQHPGGDDGPISRRRETPRPVGSRRGSDPAAAAASGRLCPGTPSSVGVEDGLTPGPATGPESDSSGLGPPGCFPGEEHRRRRLGHGLDAVEIDLDRGTRRAGGDGKLHQMAGGSLVERTAYLHTRDGSVHPHPEFTLRHQPRLACLLPSGVVHTGRTVRSGTRPGPSVFRPRPGRRRSATGRGRSPAGGTASSRPATSAIPWHRAASAGTGASPRRRSNGTNMIRAAEALGCRLFVRRSSGEDAVPGPRRELRCFAVG